MMTRFLNHGMVIIFKTFAINVRQCMKSPAWLQIMAGGAITDSPGPMQTQQHGS